MSRVLAAAAAIAALLAAWLLLWPADPLSPPAASAPAADASTAAGTAVAAASADATEALASTAGAASDRQQFAPPSAPLEFAVERTGYVGRVVDRAGTPVPGIGVRLFRGAPDVALAPGFDVFAPLPAAPQLLAAQTVSGADGRFALDGVLPRGLCFLRFDFADLQRVPPAWRQGQGTIAPVQRTPAPGEIVDLGDLVLRDGAVLRGRVVGDDGRPVAGALVRAARLPPLPFAAVPIERLEADSALLVTDARRPGVVELPAWFGDLMAALPIAAATTTADGRFVLFGVDPGDLALAVTAAGRCSLLRQGIAVEAGADTQLGDLVLGDGSLADVLVRDRHGEPVAGAEVVVAPCSVGVPVHIGARAGRTDAEGRAQLGGLPRGRALAAARRSPQSTWSVGQPGPADGELLVELPGSHALLLTVLDAAAQPARDVRLKLARGALAGGAVELSLFAFAAPLDLRQRLHRLDDGRLRIDDLDDGPWTLVVGAAGCTTESVDLQLEGDCERTVQLHAARPLEVRTVDAAGAPVAQATIYLRPRGGERARRIVELPLAAGRTDAEGRCRVRDLPTDETRITATHPRLGQVHADLQAPAPAELTLQFLATGSIAGRLTDGGRPPAPGRWLVVLERRYDQAPRGAVPDLPQLMLPAADGSFEFAALQPGRYRLTAQDSVADVGTIGGLIQYQARRKLIYPWNKAEVDLHAGERHEVRLDAMLDAAPWTGPGAEISGRLELDGLPGTGSLVVGTSTKPDRRVTSRVDAGGAFDLGRCPAGRLRVVVVPREVAESRLLEYLFSHEFARDLEVKDGEPQQLVIALHTGAVRGQVCDWNGVAVADCRVVLFDRGGDGRSSALRVERTDRRGGFAFPRLPGGSYEVHAQKEGVGRAEPGHVAVPAGGAVDGLAIALRPTAKVSGRVEVAALPRRGPLGITLTPLGGGEVVRGGGKPEGGFELKDVPVGSYRAEVQVWGDPRAFAAGRVEVVAPETGNVVLTPQQ